MNADQEEAAVSIVARHQAQLMRLHAEKRMLKVALERDRALLEPTAELLSAMACANAQSSSLLAVMGYWS